MLLRFKRADISQKQNSEKQEYCTQYARFMPNKVETKPHRLQFCKCKHIKKNMCHRFVWVVYQQTCLNLARIKVHQTTKHRAQICNETRRKHVEFHSYLKYTTWKSRCHIRSGFSAGHTALISRFKTFSSTSLPCSLNVYIANFIFNFFSESAKRNHETR